MKADGVLLVGPLPPPHGGISVHLAALRRGLNRAGVPCVVANLARSRPRRRRPLHDLGVGGALDLGSKVAACAARRWILHTHINGHNRRSWLVALGCGVAAARAPSRYLTLHSGMVPDWLENGRPWRRALVRLVCRRYDAVVCVNEEIRSALWTAGVDAERLEVLPAYVPSPPPRTEPPAWLQQWMERRDPVLATTLAFEPEYRFDLLVEAVAALRPRHPKIGCLVMGTGSGEAEARRRLARAGLEESMLLLGDVAHPTCRRVMSMSDLFVRGTDRDGDAVSVREALALGVPVVASDVGSRPPEAILFEAGDLEGMVAAVNASLRAAPVAAGRPSGVGGVDALLALYRRSADLSTLTHDDDKRPEKRRAS